MKENDWNHIKVPGGRGQNKNGCEDFSFGAAAASPSKTERWFFSLTFLLSVQQLSFLMETEKWMPADLRKILFFEKNPLIRVIFPYNLPLALLTKF